MSSSRRAGPLRLSMSSSSSLPPRVNVVIVVAAALRRCHRLYARNFKIRDIELRELTLIIRAELIYVLVRKLYQTDYMAVITAATYIMVYLWH